MLFPPRQAESANTPESGFVLVLALVMLLLLSLFGAWALQTTTFELRVAGGLQQAERQFNLAEGAANGEAGLVGFERKDFYNLPDPSLYNRPLIPTNDGDFDPGNDTTTAVADITADDATTWPWDNLLRNYDNLPVDTNSYDYRYHVTYLHSTTAPMGYNADKFAGYKHMIRGNPANGTTVVELGGSKVGQKGTL
jgi:type II secretory pathway pseudopilin PulG